MIKLTAPLTAEQTKNLKKGDVVTIDGVIYTARDAAHRKMTEEFALGGTLPLKGEIIYYAGPCPAKPGEIIGSVGPTTSYRMDAYAPLFAGNGCIYSAGKGARSKTASEAIRAAGGIHFEAIGGAGAYYKKCVVKAETAMYPELGAEAVYRLEVRGFPAIVGII